MFHFIYKTTNILNNKIYIGKHSTENIEDGYIGSGKLLLEDVKKYGKNNFIREILSFYEDEASAFNAEQKIVTKEFISREDVYNLSIGGEYGYACGLSGNLHYLNKMTEKERENYIKKYKRGESYWLSKGISKEEKEIWIKENLCGKNHSHKKYKSDDEYEQFLENKYRGDNFWLYRCLDEEQRKKYIEEQYKGKNNPIFRNKTDEEIEKWLNDNRRGENSPNAKYEYVFDTPEGEKRTRCLKTFCKENGYNLHILMKIIDLDSGKLSEYIPRDKKYIGWHGKKYIVDNKKY